LGGRRLGILGLANSTTPTQTLRANVEGLEFQAEEAIARRLVPEIRSRRIDALILLAHGVVSTSLEVRRVKVSVSQADVPPDLVAMARAVPGIDVILGGHYHTGLDDGYLDSVQRDADRGQLPQSSCDEPCRAGFRPQTGRLKSASSRLIDLDVAQTGEDPEVLELLRPYQARVEQVMGQKIGELTDDFDEPALGLFINEVMRAAAGADVAVQNPGASGRRCTKDRSPRPTPIASCV